MSRSITQDDLFSVFRGYEDRLSRIETAIFRGTIDPALMARVTKLETLRIYTVGAGSYTGALGSAFQTLPGSSTTITLAAGERVVLDASVSIVSGTTNTLTVFWVVNPAAGGQTNLNVPPSGGCFSSLSTGGTAIVGFVAGTYTAPLAQDYTFSVQATQPGGNGSAGNCVGRIIVFPAP